MGVAAVENTDALHRKELQVKESGMLIRDENEGTTYIVRGIGVVVHSTEERSRCVLTNEALDEMGATRMLVHERRDIVNKAGNEDEGPLSRLGLDCVMLEQGFVSESKGCAHSSRKR